MAPGEPVPRRIRLWAVLAASFLLLLTILNLVLVVEGEAEVSPRTQEGRSWQTGSSAPQREGRAATWTFSVDPDGARIVELEVHLPWQVRVTHVSGAGVLTHRVAFLVDGETIAEDDAEVREGPPANESSRVSVTRATHGDFSRVLRIERGADSPPFALVVTWDWSFVLEQPGDMTFSTTVPPLSVQALGTSGLPGCGLDCARVLFVLGLVAQTATFVWYRRGPQAPPGRGSDR